MNSPVKNTSYDDFAIVLAWPDTTARADEAWYRWFQKIGILHNLNFKVGHAAIILADGNSGQLHYYDFGRYITPRGDGRARSAQSDPKLALKTRALIQRNGHQIANIDEIIGELEQKKRDTHGKGELFYSVAKHFSIKQGKSLADKMVSLGSVTYSAFAPGNNNCSRFVQQVLCAGLRPDSSVRSNVFHPETFVASPVSNVVNATENNQIYRTLNGETKAEIMTRTQSLWHFLHQTSENFVRRKAQLLPSDQNLGFISEPDRPKEIPTSAQWLGGIGEGGWYHLEYDHSSETIRAEAPVTITKYDFHGEIEIRGTMSHTENRPLYPHQPYNFTYDAHAFVIRIQQNSIIFRFTPTDVEAVDKHDAKALDRPRIANQIQPKKQLTTISNEPQYS
jgi:hypothetical protein